MRAVHALRRSYQLQNSECDRRFSIDTPPALFPLGRHVYWLRPACKTHLASIGLLIIQRQVILNYIRYDDYGYGEKYR